MKVVSTEALTKLIQLVKSAFISVDDTVETSEVDVYTKNEVDNLILGGNLYGDVVVDNEFLCMNSTCSRNPYITSFSAPICKKAKFFATFAGSSVTSINLQNLEEIASFCYDGNTQSEEFGFCANCINLTSVNLDSLRILHDRAFDGAFQYTQLQSLSFPSLTSTSFQAPTDAEWSFQGMLLGVTGCTVHFPSNLQSVIGSWYDVTHGFSGTNTTILFDLPATE